MPATGEVNSGEALDIVAMLSFQQISLVGAAGGIPLREVYMVNDLYPTLMSIFKSKRGHRMSSLDDFLHFLTFVKPQMQKSSVESVRWSCCPRI